VTPDADEKQTPLILEFFASELRLRGQSSIVQPHEKEGDVLCWNGEVYPLLNVLITFRVLSDHRESRSSMEWMSAMCFSDLDFKLILSVDLATRERWSKAVRNIALFGESCSDSRPVCHDRGTVRRSRFSSESLD
jgi:hypothetical protein